MPVYSPDEPGYWDRFPPDLKDMKAVVDAQGVRVSFHILGDATDDAAPTAMMFHMPPGYELPRHGHPCQRLEVVIEGTLRVGDHVYGPGTVLASDDSTPYGPHYAGANGCVTMEIFSSRVGAHSLMVFGPDGAKQTVDLAGPDGVAMAAALTGAPSQSESAQEPVRSSQSDA